VFVALVIQHAMHMRRIMLIPVACPAPQYFSTLSQKRQDLEKKVIGRKKCVLFPLQRLSETFVILRRTEGDTIINLCWFPCTVLIIFAKF